MLALNTLNQEQSTFAELQPLAMPQYICLNIYLLAFRHTGTKGAVAHGPPHPDDTNPSDALSCSASLEDCSAVIRVLAPPCRLWSASASLTVFVSRQDGFRAPTSVSSV